MNETLLLFKNFNFYLLISNLIFIGGIFSIIIAKNIINWLVSIELLFISSIINFLIFALYHFNTDGYIFALIIIILAAVEAALGLSIIAIFYNNNKNISITKMEQFDT